MSIDYIKDQALLSELKALRREVRILRSMISVVVQNNNVVLSHSGLTDLDYASSGHTGFASTTALNAHTGDNDIHRPFYVQNAQPSDPTTLESAIWVNNTSLPWKAAIFLKNGSGAYEAIQFAEANP